MADDKLIENFAHTLTNFFKNTELFDKFNKFTDKTSNGLIIVGVFSSICLGVTLLTYSKLDNIKNDNKCLMSELKSMKVLTDQIIFKLHDYTLNVNTRILKDTCEMETQTDGIDGKLNGESNSCESLNGNFKINEDVVNEIASSIINNNSVLIDNYDELANECYDMIPCSNAKKILPNKSFSYNIFSNYYT
jgi:hypothetical protein